MTPAQVLTLVKDESFNDTSLATDAQIYTYMSNGEIILAQRVKCTETTESFNTVASTREYTLSSELTATPMAIQRVLYDSVKLKKIDLVDLDLVEGTTYGGTTQEGNCVYYYQYGDTIGFSPIPDAVKAVKLYFLKRPTVLTSSSTAFTIPDYEHYLVDYCLYRMFLKDQELANEGRAHLELWERNLLKAESDWVRRKATDKHSVVKIEEDYPETDIGFI